MSKFKHFLKILGICLAGMVGLIGVTVGVLAIMGEFSQKHIPLESFTFEYTTYILDEDTDILLVPNPIDSTELDVEITVTVNKNLITLPEEIKIGTPFKVELNRDANDNIIGGECGLQAISGGMLMAECSIFIDVPVKSFDLTTSGLDNFDPTQDLTTVYPGDSFSVGLTNVNPLNSINPSTNSNLNIAKQDKVVHYFSSNPTIATVDEFTGEVKVLNVGHFVIDAYVVTTYNNLNNLPLRENYPDDETYEEEFNKYVVRNSLEFNSDDLELESISATQVIQEVNLLQTHRFTAEDLELKLYPQSNSNYTYEDLEYRLKEIELTAGYVLKDGTFTETDACFTLVKGIDNELPYWDISVIEYASGGSKTPVLKASLDNFQTFISFHINKVDVTELSINTPNNDNILNLNIKNRDERETYSLTENFVLNPSNSTYNKVLFFVDVENAQDSIISCDENKVICSYINTDDYEVGPNGELIYITEKVYGLITPLTSGTTRIKAKVVKTDINGEIIGFETGEFEVEYEMTNWVTINITEDLYGFGLDVESKNGSQPENNYNNQNRLESTTLNVGDEATVNIIIDENLKLKALIDAYLKDEISFAVSDPLKVQFNVLTDGTSYLNVGISAIKKGSSSFSIKYRDEFVYSITINILEEELNAITLKVNNGESAEVKAIFDNQNVVWKVKNAGGEYLTYLKDNLSLSFDPSETTKTAVQLKTFNVNNEEDNSVLEITNDESGNISKAEFNFKKQGTVKIKAISLNQSGVESNEITINVVVDSISVEKKYDNLQTYLSNDYEKIYGGQVISNLLKLESNDPNKVDGDRFIITNGETTENSGLLHFELDNVDFARVVYENGIYRLETDNVYENKYFNLNIITDFGYTDTYGIMIVPNVDASLLNSNIGSKDNPHKLVAFEEVDLFDQNSPYVSLVRKSDGATYSPTSSDDSGLKLNFSCNKLDGGFLTVSQGKVMFSNVEFETKVTLYITTEFNYVYEYYFLVQPNLSIEIDYSNDSEVGGTKYENLALTSVANANSLNFDLNDIFTVKFLDGTEATDCTIEFSLMEINSYYRLIDETSGNKQICINNDVIGEFTKDGVLIINGINDDFETITSSNIPLTDFQFVFKINAKVVNANTTYEVSTYYYLNITI